MLRLKREWGAKTSQHTQKLKRMFAHRSHHFFFFFWAATTKVKRIILKSVSPISFKDRHKTGTNRKGREQMHGSEKQIHVDRRTSFTFVDPLRFFFFLQIVDNLREKIHPSPFHICVDEFHTRGASTAALLLRYPLNTNATIRFVFHLSALLAVKASGRWPPCRTATVLPVGTAPRMAFCSASATTA